MKKTKHPMLGVTLLEIMLVLAIAAMIIVMSVRYYQSASSSQQANTTVQQVQAITAAADSLAQSTGSYSAASVNTSTVKALVPQNSMTTPWGSAITVTGATPTNYSVTIASMPTAVCPLVLSRLKANNHYDVSSVTCGTSPANFTYKYIANP